MRWNAGFSSFLLLSVSVFLLVALVSTEARLRKRKFDGDFEFADEEEAKSNRKEGKKTWILDPGSDLCQALQCKKKELCLLEDEYTAVCVSKKELHKNGDVIIPKSKLKESTSTKLDETDSKEYDEDEDDDSDYYDDDDDSDEDLLPNTASSSSSNNNNNKLDKTSGSVASNGLPATSSDLLNSASGNSFKSCSPCPVVKPTFLCGSDNRTYSSLCRLDYHNCIQNSQVTISCKGFCPCKGGDEVQRKHTTESDRLSRFMQTYKKTVANLKMQQQQQNMAKKSFRSQKKDNGNNLDALNTLSDDSNVGNNNYFTSNDFASGSPVSANTVSGQSFKDRYVKYKDYSGAMSKKTSLSKLRSYNDVMNVKPSSGRDCSQEALESMGDRLLDWFSVVMADTQKRKLSRRNRSNQVHFPGDCKREVQWMFSHLNSDEDGQLSLQELYDLENDRSEKCIKPFIDRCDTDNVPKNDCKNKWMAFIRAANAKYKWKETKTMYVCSEHFRPSQIENGYFKGRAVLKNEIPTILNGEIIEVHIENDIAWSYVSSLQKLQEESGLKLANKLSSRHVCFQNQKMKTKLCVQVFSNSVSVALGVCRELQIAGFEHSEATEKFLLLFDEDIFISPLEWCNCFTKLDRRCSTGNSRTRGKSNCAPLSDRDANDVDDEDSEIEGSSDGPLEI